MFDPGLNTRWRTAVDAHKAHATAEWPREACGLIDQAGAYHACTNIAADPVAAFEVPDHELRAVDGGRPAAFLHSHVGREGERGQTLPPLNSPTSADMHAQLDMAVPWGISLCVRDGASDPFWFGDQVPRAPLIGRPFRHGVHDCYALIRDWHAEVAGISIPEFPRDDLWWDGASHSLYDQFAEAGFARVQRENGPLPGDVFLCRVHASVINHGGIYVGDGTILHHIVGHLSLRSPAERWRSKLDFLVRHGDLPDGWEPSLGWEPGR